MKLHHCQQKMLFSINTVYESQSQDLSVSTCKIAYFSQTWDNFGQVSIGY